jgi:transaldolase
VQEQASSARGRRVETAADVNDCADAIVKRGRHLVELFKEVGVPPEKYLLRIPATWQGIQAARVLENEGVATHLILIYRRDTGRTRITTCNPCPQNACDSMSP